MTGRAQKCPRNVPDQLWMYLVKNISRPDFIIFARNIFITLKTPRRSFSTLWLPQGAILYHKITTCTKNQRKIVIAKINLSHQRNLKNKIEKSRLGPKLDAGGKPSTMSPPGRLVKLPPEFETNINYERNQQLRKIDHHFHYFRVGKWWASRVKMSSRKL